MEKMLPLQHIISFNKLLQQYEDIAKGSDEYLAKRARYIIDKQAPFPELRAGFTELSLLEKHKEIIDLLLQDSFSPLLSDNEIKTASLPYSDIIFNASNRFNRILEAAGPDYKPKITNLEQGVDYIMACVVILNYYYGFKLDFKRIFFYNIPDAQGVMRHYRILYNAEFMEIIPNGTPLEITQDDVDELLVNIDDLALWKQKIPPNSFISKGFVISNMFDVTAEHVISEIKSNLIVWDYNSGNNFLKEVEESFKSLFGLSGLRLGFVKYNAKLQQFESAFYEGIKSYLLKKNNLEKCNTSLCLEAYDKLLEQNSMFVISDVEKEYIRTEGKAPFKNLYDQNIKSALFAPIAKKGKLIGVLELVSDKANDLNSINGQKLEDIMPYIVSAALRSMEEEENLIDAVIQNECTSVHPSVSWRFEEEAKRFIKEKYLGNEPSFREIVFNDVHPLYGQIDIRNSSQIRNEAIQRDLTIQLSEIKNVLTKVLESHKLPIYEELIFRVNNYLADIKDSLHSTSEQDIFDFVTKNINPVFEYLSNSDDEIKKRISLYNSHIDLSTGTYYDHRRNYDESVTFINKKLAGVLDKSQEQAQKMFPHYFERYKTDGIEHNMYIGSAISAEKNFAPIFLSNLRLWQLQMMCELENAHYRCKPELKVKLDVASLILVYNTSLSIRFRMDEKRFDVDGTYNARYEIIKKRIDKSFIKGTQERLTQSGKLVIVYAQKRDESEYLRYINFLRSKGYFNSDIEIVELEGLQGVSGLKAIRAGILYRTEKKSDKTYTYQDLMNELKA
ncbi:GAF domain-containing protein [Arenibacter latericius]|uniref:GAF domain-containing protein n=1 Tax=Arenibacter latericius TaxID=86104 RepID=UPI0003FF4F84|nr:GAF domain-containing protein [Arenibacter latericius]